MGSFPVDLCKGGNVRLLDIIGRGFYQSVLGNQKVSEGAWRGPAFNTS